MSEDKPEEENKVINFGEFKEDGLVLNIAQFISNLSGKHFKHAILIGLDENDRVCLVSPEWLDNDEILNLLIDGIYDRSLEKDVESRGLVVYENYKTNDGGKLLLNYEPNDPKKKE